MMLVELLSAVFRRPKVQPNLAPLGDYYAQRNAMAREWDLPRQWVICPNCGEQDWVLPPHGLEQCPLLIQMAEQMGLKIDAERMMAVRTGINIEEMTSVLRNLTGEEGE